MNKSILLITILTIASVLFLGVVIATTPDCISEDHTMKEISVMVYEQGEDIKMCK